jgi:uncharacterized YigZ family protein
MLFEDTYNTINSTTAGEFKDRGSRFIAYSVPVKSETDVKEQLELIRKKHHDARHHCYAYRLGPDKSAYRINDDGEPSGTAGKPIYGQILSKDLTNILIVVVRYFGGTKLGVSGLINAYKTSAREALEKATILTKTINDIYEVEFEYDDTSSVMRILKDEGLKPYEQIYEEKCMLKFEVRKKLTDRVYERFNKINNLKIKYLYTK